MRPTRKNTPIMKLSPILRPLLFAAATVICYNASAQEYARAIPADAAVVVRLDAARIVSLAGADPAALLNEKLGDCAEPAPAVLSVLMGITADPERSGIDFSSPVCIFFSQKARSGGIAAQVADADCLRALVRKAAADAGGRIETVKGVTCVSDKESCLVFDDRAAVMIRSDKAPAPKKLCGEFARRGRGITATEGFRRLAEADGEIAVLVSGSAIDGKDLKHNPVLKEAPINDLAFVGSLKSGRGEVTAEWEIMASGAEAERFVQKHAAMRGPTDGRYADRIPESAVFVSYGAFRGDRLAETADMLSELESPEIDTLIGALSSLDGDFALFLTAPIIKGMSIDMGGTLVAAVKDRTAMNLLAEKLELAEADDGYASNDGETNITLTEHDGTMVLTGGTPAPETTETAAARVNPKIKGCYGYCYIGVREIASGLAPVAGMFGPYLSLLSRLEYIEAVAAERSGRSTIRFADADDNIYKFLTDAGAEASERFSVSAYVEEADEAE